MVGRWLRGSVVAMAVSRIDAALLRHGQRPDATHRVVAEISVQVQAHTERVAGRTCEPMLLIDMKVLLCGATVLRKFGYSKSQYSTLPP